MKTNRRNFLKSASLVASVGTAAIALPAVAIGAIPEAAKTAFDDGQVETPQDAIVKTQQGLIRGYKKGKVYNFKGIRYAESTEKTGRFLPAQSLKPWKGVKNALVYGPVSPQKINNGWLQQEYGFLYQWIDGFQHEDCLRLNIWTSAIIMAKKRPVMFWIHGGGFTTGSSQEHPSYDGQNLVDMGDVVVVSVNHRLNVFGFADLSDYGPEYCQSSNLGMLDLVEALKWVKQNIEVFGGDPDNITIYGQSGGGSKVITLMAMPAAKGLFHKAIAQSNSILQVSTPEYAKKLTKLFLNELKLDKSNIKKINDLPATELLAAAAAAEQKMGSQILPGMGRAGWQPVAHTPALPTHPFDPEVSDLAADIPFLVGSTRNEASASLDNPEMESLDEAGLKERINKRFPNLGSELYSALRKTHPGKKPVELLSFISAQNPIAYLAASRKAMQKPGVYLYLFSWHTKNLDGRPRSFHCSEIPFVFNNTGLVPSYTGGTREAADLAKKMARAWINFARFGDPNHGGLPKWPAFNVSQGAMMVFNKECTVETDPDSESREVLERIFYAKEF